MAMHTFVEAFAGGRLDAAAALLAEDATTELVGAPVPSEQGPAAIRAGSFAHMAAGDPPLAVEKIDDTTVWLTHGPGGPLDVVIELHWNARQRIDKLRYFTLWHAAEYVRDAASARGREVADPQ